MDPNQILMVVWKRWKKSKTTKQTLKQRSIERRRIAKLIFICKLMKMNEEEARHRMWVRPICTERQRALQGASVNLVREMEYRDPEMVYNYCRMSVEMFYQLLAIVGPHIEKQHVIRDPIPARTRLLVCLRYLARYKK